MFKLGSKIRLISLILLISVTLLSLFYLNKLENDLKDSEVLGASVLADTLSFLFKSRIQSLLVMLHSLNYVQLTSLEEHPLRDWLLVFYRAYEPFVYLVGFIREDGKVLATYPKDESLEGKDVSSWKSFRTVKGARISYVGEFITTSGGKRGIGVFAPLFDGERNIRGVFFYVYNYEVLTDALVKYLKALKSPWAPVIVDSDGRLIFGDEKIASVLSEAVMERTKSFSVGGVEYLLVHSSIPLSITSDWHLFLYAPTSSLGTVIGRSSLLIKALLLLVTVVITLVVLFFHRGIREERRVFPEIVDFDEEEEVELPQHDKLESEETPLRELFPGVVIELDGALEILSIRGEDIAIESIDKERIKDIVKRGEGVLDLLGRTFFFKVVSTKDGRFLLFGEDRTKEKNLLKALEDNLLFLISGRLLRDGKEPEKVKRVVLSAKDAFGRVSLNDLLLELKEGLSLGELELKLEDGLPSPWLNPAYVKGILLTFLLRAIERGGKVIAEARYLKDKVSVSLRLCVQGTPKLFKEGDMELSIINSLALKSGIRLKVLDDLKEEYCFEMELPIYPPFEGDEK